MTEAIARRGPDRNYGNVFLMGLCHFTSDFYCNVLPVMLPVLAVKFGISYSACGVLFMIYSVTTNLLQMPLGLAADRKPINFLMPLSIITGGFFACLIGAVDSLVPLVAVILLSGICASGFHPICSKILVEVIPKGHETLSTSIFIAGGNIGFAVAPLIFAAFIEAVGAEQLLWLVLPALITVALVYVRRCERNVAPPPGAAKGLNMHEIMHNRELLLLTSSISLRSWCYCAMVVYLPLLLSSHGHSGVESASALVVMLLGSVVGGLATGSLSDRFGLRMGIALSYLITLAGAVYFLLWPGTTWDAMAALFITGAGMYGSTPAAIVWTQRLMPGNAALASSTVLGFTFGIGYIESVLTGWLGDRIGLAEALLATVAPAVVAALVILFMLKAPPAAISTIGEGARDSAK